jgi:sugar phosphate permease
LARSRQLHVVCGLSFALTFVREIFNVWIVDFIKTEGDPGLSSGAAALLSTPFDIMGGLGILAMGWAYGRLSGRGRVRLLVAVLGLLAVVLWTAPVWFRAGLWGVTAVVALVGALVYGPYSLLAGVLAVQTRGAGSAATVAGLVDGTGYLAGALSGVFFGRLLSVGGYELGVHAMALCAALAAVLCLGLDRKGADTGAGAPAGDAPGGLLRGGPVAKPAAS